MSHREPVATEEPTIGKLVVDASRDVSSLIQSEIALAKSELKVSVKAGGISIALFAAAGFLALLAIIMLSVAFAYFIALHRPRPRLVLPDRLRASTCCGRRCSAFIGVRKIKQVKAPERAIAQGKQIPAALKGQAEPPGPRAQAQLPLDTLLSACSPTAAARRTWSAVSA